MALAEELLDNISEEQAAEYALSELKPHIVIDEDRNIILPERYKKIASQGDHNMATYTFDCPRFSDGRDMSEMVVYINYIRSDGKTGSYPADNVSIDAQNTDLMHFDWTLLLPATFAEGVLAFLVCVCRTGNDGKIENHWSSRMCREAMITEGMDCHKDTIVDLYPDIITRILERLNVLEDGGTNSVQYTIQDLEEEQKAQARKNIGAADAAEVSKLSEDIADIKQNGTGTGNGLTTAQRNSLLAVVNAIGTFNVANGQELIDNFNSAWKITINATGVTLDKTTLTFVESVNQTLVATVEPSDSTDEVMWASSNESIAKVTNGIVTPISNGSCTITATAGSVSASCEVTVNVETAIVTYTVVNNLTNVSTDNPVGTIAENSGYTAILTPDTDYEFDSVVVTMGGVDVTSDVYANGTIVISKVTGNVVITASAKEVDTEQITYLSWIGTLDGESYIDTEYVPISVNHKYMFGIQYYEEKADMESYPIAGLTLPFGQSNWTMRITTPSLESNEFPYRISYYFGSTVDTLNIGEHKYDSSKEILTITNNPMYLYLTNGKQALYSNEEMTEQPTGGTFSSLTKNIEITSADDLHPLVPIYLGALNDLYANRVTYGYVKLYCFKVWDENDNLLVYMRPAKKGTQVGMYDEIRGTFHENKGSGSFEYEEV